MISTKDMEMSKGEYGWMYIEIQGSRKTPQQLKALVLGWLAEGGKTVGDRLETCSSPGLGSNIVE